MEIQTVTEPTESGYLYDEHPFPPLDRCEVLLSPSEERAKPFWKEKDVSQDTLLPTDYPLEKGFLTHREDIESK
jgi:hypothetical protein